jgi:hypothetical protein
MIKLNRNLTPILLTPIFVKQQTELFKLSGNNVWNVDWLKRNLLELSNGKCAYCECDIKEESKYLEVEHFEDKSHYPDKVMEWSNLLPSCKRCNGSKSDHDVIAEPIVNPFVDTPAIHICFQLYRMKGKDDKGENTINVIDLNNTERAVQKRFEVGEALHNLIETAYERLINYKTKVTVQRKNRLVGIITDILHECQPDSIYSATCATVLHSNGTYTKIVQDMKLLSLWSSEFDRLDGASKSIIL